jgi:sterol desaturase/sphingolipid hydroxylase (fatty acid hydroxylase superfamily)
MTRDQIAYHADYVLFSVILAILVWWQGAELSWLIAIPSGVLVWTFAEYVLHRAIFHRVPVIRNAHDLHHINPMDYGHFASSLITVPLAGVVVACSMFAFGANAGAGFAIGFFLGYMAYGIVHELFHHVRLRVGHWLVPARKRHTMHHCGLEANFGVTTPLWDHVFGTYVSHRQAWN